LVYTGLLVLRIDYALTITCFIAIIDLFPFIGTGILFIPWILYMFMTAEYAMVIGLSILYMYVIVQRQLLEPKIRAASVGDRKSTRLNSSHVSISYAVFCLRTKA